MKIDKIYKIAIIVLAIIMLTHITLYTKGREKTHACIDSIIESKLSPYEMSIAIKICESKFSW